MRVILRSFLALLSMMLAISALFELRATNRLQSARDWTPPTFGEEFTDQLGVAQAASEVIGADGTSFALRSTIQLERANAQKDPATRIALYCAALDSLAEALKRDHRNGRYLLNWVNTRQILGDTECHSESDLPRSTSANANLREVAALAISSDPNNVKILYGSALIALWSGDKPRALDYFKRFLMLATKLSAGQQQNILNLVRSGKELEAVIPPRFPQVSQWSALFKSERPDDYEEMRGAFQTLQTAALQESKESLLQGRIPMSLHYDRMSTLAELAASNAVRQQADLELAAILKLERNETLAGYLSERAKYKSLPVVKTSMPLDSRVLKTALVRWEQDAAFHFNDSYRTVGFFLPEGASVKTIELRSSTRPANITPALIKLYVSKDNQTWSELAQSGEIVSGQMNGRTLYVLHVKDEGYRYWKVHFANSGHDRSFYGTLGEMLRVYGLSAGGA